MLRLPVVHDLPAAAPETARDGAAGDGHALSDVPADQHETSDLVALFALDEAQRHEIVFIDTGVADWQTLAAGIDPGSEIVLIDPSRDGVSQITDALAGRSGIDAVHVISHGGEGFVQLGADDLVGRHPRALPTADRRLGCIAHRERRPVPLWLRRGAGGDGLAFVDSISALTGADVAASDDPTGAADLGGDWQLETTVGSVETAVAVNLAGQAAFGHVLPVSTLSTPDLIAADDTGSSDTDNVTKNTILTFTGNGAVPGSHRDDVRISSLVWHLGTDGGGRQRELDDYDDQRMPERLPYTFSVPDDAGSMPSAALT